MAKISRDARAYYAGGVKMMMGGVPCRFARPCADVSGLLAESSREMREGVSCPSYYSKSERARWNARRVADERAAYAAALGISVADAAKRIAAQSAILAPFPEAMAA